MKKAPFLHRLFWGLACGALFFTVYGFSNSYTESRMFNGESLATWAMAWEAKIPFWAWTIIPYWSEDLFFAFTFWSVRSSKELSTLVKRLVTSILLAAAIFYLVPLAPQFVRPKASGAFAEMFQALYGIDKPYNLFPSLHITLGMIMLDVLLRRYKGIARYCIGFWFFMIFASTLTTWQHQVVDLIGGFYLGALVLHLFPTLDSSKEKSEWSAESAKLSLLNKFTLINKTQVIIYGSLALLCSILFWNNKPIGSIWLWPMTSLCILVYAYLFNDRDIYRKNTDGKIPWYSQVVMGPAIIGQRLSRSWYALKSPAVSSIPALPQLYFGRALNDRESQDAINQFNIKAVLDLTTEASEAKPFREFKSDYFNLPLLDLTAPTKLELNLAIWFIDKSLDEKKNVYIHCKAGYSRTAAVVGAYLQHKQICTSQNKTMDLMIQNRPGMVIRPEIQKILLN